jgi:hypothetical protein
MLNNGTKSESRKETERPDNYHNKDQPDNEERAMI